MRRIVPKIILFMLLPSLFALAVKDQVSAGTPIKVLNVSTFCYNEVREIINIVGASSLFEVTQVGILDFNNGNPSDLSTYDVIVFGISNRFEGPDAYYAPYAGVIGRISELKDYVNNGGGIVWTHDSLETGNDYGANAEEPAGVDFTLPGSAIGSAVTKIINEHEVLHYPFEIGNVGDTIDILQTHTWYGTVTTATIVMKFDGQPASSGNFYLTVHEYGNGRVAVIELGCLTLMEYDGTFGSWPSIRESKIFVNTLYWASSRGVEPIPAFPVGGYSLQTSEHVEEKQLMLYLATVAILTASFTITKCKPRKRRNNS